MSKHRTLSESISGEVSNVTPLQRFSWKLQVVAVRVVVFLINCLPERAANCLGTNLGRLTFLIVRDARAKTLENIAFVRTDLDEAQQLALGKESFESLGLLIAEWARLYKLSPEEILARIEYRGVEQLKESMDQGKGVILIGAHHTNWELMFVAVAGHLTQLGAETLGVGRPLRNAELYDLVLSVRNKTGAKTVPQKVLGLMRGLRKGGVIGLLVDQYWKDRRGGVLVPFLGRPAWTTMGPVFIAKRTGASVHPVSLHRLENGKHEIVYGEKIEMPDSGDEQADLVEGMRRINHEVEEIIRRDPSAWLWMQHRWRKSPELKAFLEQRKASKS